MQRKQNVIRIILMVSLILHLAVFLNMKGIILQARVYRSRDTVQADIVKVTKSSAIKPPSIQPPKIEISKRAVNPSKKIRKALSKSSPGQISSSRLPQRAIITRLPDQNIAEAEIPVLDIDTPMQDSLPDPTSSLESATGASSWGSGGDNSSGSGRGGGGMGRAASISPREVTKRDIPLDEKFNLVNEAEIPFIKALTEIAEHVENVSKSRKVDIVFIVDTSESMKDDINAVRKHLNLMIDTFLKGNLDFTLGVVRFHHSMVYEWLGMDIVISKQTTDVEEIKKILKSIRVSGGERALDALMRAIEGVEFRPGVERHFILLTDEYVHGTYPVAEVLKAAKRSNIIIDVLGRDEPFQRTIAEQTGGIWASIEEIE